MRSRNRVGIGLSYRPDKLHSPAELVPLNRFLSSLKVQKFGSWLQQPKLICPPWWNNWRIHLWTHLQYLLQCFLVTYIQSEDSSGSMHRVFTFLCKYGYTQGKSTCLNSSIVHICLLLLTPEMGERGGVYPGVSTDRQNCRDAFIYLY